MFKYTKGFGAQQILGSKMSAYGEEGYTRKTGGASGQGFETTRNWDRREFENALARVKWSFATRLRERTGTKVSKAYLVGWSDWFNWIGSRNHSICAKMGELMARKPFAPLARIFR